MSLQDDIAALTTSTLFRWNAGTPLGTPTFVTYSFPTSKAAYDTRSEFEPLGEAYKPYVRTALDTWSAISGIRFLEVPTGTDGQIRFNFTFFGDLKTQYGDQAYGYAHNPRLDTVTRGGVETQTARMFDIGGDVWLNPTIYRYNPESIAPGTNGYWIVLHEIGHALGFKHPFAGTSTIEPAHDNSAYTIMSYSRPLGTTALGSVDIAATQFYYGANPYDYSWDASTLSLTVNGTAGDDTILGTELNDRLNGGDGNDRLIGGLGNNIIDGGASIDTVELRDPSAAHSFVKTADGFIVKGPSGTQTLSHVEILVTSDGMIDLSAMETTFKAIFRSSSGNGPTETAARIDLGSSGHAYFEALIGEARSTTVAALVVTDLLEGAAPTAERLDALAAFATNQLAYYRWIGAASPELGPYEALGRAFAETASFQTQYGSGTDGTFIADAYQDVFGRAATPAQLTAFQAQISFFEALYATAKIPEAAADLYARGAVIGQMIGHAVLSEADLHPYFADARAILQDAADGLGPYARPLAMNPPAFDLI